MLLILPDDWFAIRMQDAELNEQISAAQAQLDERRADLDARFDEKSKKLKSGDDLAPGVLKTVKVYLAVKRRIQPGDKMAGRHGNKGVISVSSLSKICLMMRMASQWILF